MIFSFSHDSVRSGSVILMFAGFVNQNFELGLFCVLDMFEF